MSRCPVSDQSGRIVGRVQALRRVPAYLAAPPRNGVYVLVCILRPIFGPRAPTRLDTRGWQGVTRSGGGISFGARLLFPFPTITPQERAPVHTRK